MSSPSSSTRPSSTSPYHHNHGSLRAFRTVLFFRQYRLHSSISLCTPTESEAPPPPRNVKNTAPHSAVRTKDASVNRAHCQATDLWIEVWALGEHHCCSSAVTRVTWCRCPQGRRDSRGRVEVIRCLSISCHRINSTSLIPTQSILGGTESRLLLSAAAPKAWEGGHPVCACLTQGIFVLFFLLRAVPAPDD